MTRRGFGIPGFSRGLLVLLLVALPAPFFQAEAATNPFDELDAIKIAVEVGGPLDLEGGTAPRLFTGEMGRATRFRTALSRRVGGKLESCGILWDEGHNEVLSIFVFGRLEQPPAGPPLYVYMVKGQVLNSKLMEDRPGLGPFPLRSVLGVASDDGLEDAIIDAAVAIVTDELGSCESSPPAEPEAR